MHFKSFIRALTASAALATTPAVISSVPTPAAATPAAVRIVPQEEEAAARILCTDSAPENADKFCTEWAVTATCALIYADTAPMVSKLYSDADMQKFRSAAAKALPDSCEPLAALNLKAEILERDTGLAAPTMTPRQRTAAWRDIAMRATGGTKSAPLAREQYPALAERMIDDAEFAELYKTKEIKKFITDTVSYITSTKSASGGGNNGGGKSAGRGIELLKRLEDAGIPLGDDAELVLLADALRGARKMEAASRADRVRFGSLNAARRDMIRPYLQKSALILLGSSGGFGVPYCIRGYKPGAAAANRDAMLEVMGQPEGATADIMLRANTERLLPACKPAKLARMWAEAYSMTPRPAGLPAYTAELVRYTINAGANSLTEAIVAAAAAMPADASEAFRKAHGAELAAAALPAVRAMYEAGRHADAIRAIEPVASISAGTPAEWRVRILKGLILESAANNEAARREWGYIVDNGRAADHDALETAFLLSILSFRHDGRPEEADRMMAQFDEVCPGSRMADMLR